MEPSKLEHVWEVGCQSKQSEDLMLDACVANRVTLQREVAGGGAAQHGLPKPDYETDEK